MRLLRIVTATVLAALVGTTVAFATSRDHGRRLAGPFCVDIGDGTVHAVKYGQKCKPGQIPKLGVAVTGPPGPPGKDGVPGAQGPAGPQGNGGGTGPAGQLTVTQLENGCVQITGSDGSTGTVCAPPCPTNCCDRPPVLTDSSWAKKH